MGNKRANLSVPAGWSQQDRRFGESVKQNLDTLQGLRGDKLDRAVTFRDLSRYRACNVSSRYYKF